jgi:hypothetical protein
MSVDGPCRMGERLESSGAQRRKGGVWSNTAAAYKHQRTGVGPRLASCPSHQQLRNRPYYAQLNTRPIDNRLDCPYMAVFRQYHGRQPSLRD